VETYREWKAGQITATEAMRQIGMKKPAFYRRVREYEEANEWVKQSPVLASKADAANGKMCKNRHVPNDRLDSSDAGAENGAMPCQISRP
jgi:hypothetical protein